MIIIINGAPGSGKTKTAQYLFENTDKSAFIDGDWLLAITPEHKNDEERRLRYKNITSLAKNYSESGFTNIFVSFVYISDTNLQEQITQLKELGDVKVFALTPTDERLRERHTKDDYKREGIETSIELNHKIATLNGVISINNSDLSIEQVTNIIQKELKKSA